MDTDDRVLIIERVFDAPRELVWDAFTRTEHLMQWMGPRDHPAVSYEADPRVGGKWRACLRSPDGKEVLWQGGVFHEISPPERVVYTFQWDKRTPDDVTFATLVTITFAEEGDRTRMHFQQSYFNSNANRDGHNFGWNGSFDRLADFLKETRA
jgi:uncharacterized protein YndB with AHSA1/START domain